MVQTKNCQVCGVPYVRKWGLPQFQASKVCSRRCSVRLGHPNRKWPTLEERFWAKVDKSPGHGPDGECWVWTANRLPFGYGTLKIGRRTCKAHRVSYEMHIGPIPDGLFVLHRCDMPGCVNPSHLFLGDDYDNTADKVSKGRQGKAEGVDNANAVLTPEKVRSIRADRRRLETVAAEMGVHVSTIKAVRMRRTWRHVE